MTSNLIVTIATHALNPHTIRGGQVTETMDAEALTSAVRTHRLSGLAASMLAAKALDLPSAHRQGIRDLDLRAQRQTVTAERDLLAVTDRLRTASVPFRVLKGPAYAHRHWDLPEYRPFVDFDLLVRGEDLGDVVDICEQMGGVRQHVELRAGFDRRFGKGVTLRGPSGIEWDLHRTLSLGPFGFLVDLDDLWDNPHGFELAGRWLECPPPEAEFVHACLHVATTGSARLLSLRDVFHVGETARRDEIERIASSWRATAVVQEAVGQMTKRLELQDSPLSNWAAALEPGSDERDLLVSYTEAGYSASTLARLAVRHVPGLWGKAAYTAAFVMPDRSNRRSRQRSALGHLRAVMRDLR